MFIAQTLSRMANFQFNCLYSWPTTNGLLVRTIIFVLAIMHVGAGGTCGCFWTLANYRILWTAETKAQVCIFTNLGSSPFNNSGESNWIRDFLRSFAFRLSLLCSVRFIWRIWRIWNQVTRKRICRCRRGSLLSYCWTDHLWQRASSLSWGNRIDPGNM